MALNCSPEFYHSFLKTTNQPEASEERVGGEEQMCSKREVRVAARRAFREARIAARGKYKETVKEARETFKAEIAAARKAYSEAR